MGSAALRVESAVMSSAALPAAVGAVMGSTGARSCARRRVRQGLMGAPALAATRKKAGALGRGAGGWGGAVA